MQHILFGIFQLKMQNLLLSLETEFYLFTGIDLEGISGLFIGLLIFCLFLFIIRFEKKREILIHDVDLSNEIGNEKLAKINLSRSLIEMDQKDEAKRLLQEVLEDTPSPEEKRNADLLLSKIGV